MLNMNNLFLKSVFKDNPDDDSVQTWDGNKWTYGDINSIDSIQGTGSLWRANPGTGDMTHPENLNGSSLTSSCYAEIVNQYVIVEFNKALKLKRWRQSGAAYHNLDGRWTFQYLNLSTGEWTNWVTNIPTVLYGWTDYTTQEMIITTKFKVISTALDTGNSGDDRSNIVLEVIY